MVSYSIYYGVLTPEMSAGSFPENTSIEGFITRNKEKMNLSDEMVKLMNNIGKGEYRSMLDLFSFSFG